MQCEQKLVYKLGGQQSHYRLTRSLRHRFNVSLFICVVPGIQTQRQWVDGYYHGLKHVAVLLLVATNLTVVHSIVFGSVAFSFRSLIGTVEMGTASKI